MMWTIPFTTISKLTQSDNENIKRQKIQFNFDDKNELEYIKFPGFKATYCDKLLQYVSLYKDNFTNKLTPPRGNISTSSKFAIIGIRPGKMFKETPHEESCWLFGPSSTMIHDLNDRLGYMPYLTNVYKQWDDTDDHKSIITLLHELSLVRAMSNSPSYLLVTLDRYSEYDAVSIFAKKNHFSYLNIWHPSYLCRSYSTDKFNRWVESISLNLNSKIK